MRLAVILQLHYESIVASEVGDSELIVVSVVGNSEFTVLSVVENTQPPDFNSGIPNAKTEILDPNPRIYLAPSVFKVVVQKSIPTQIRQLILYISSSNG